MSIIPDKEVSYGQKLIMGLSNYKPFLNEPESSLELCEGNHKIFPYSEKVQLSHGNLIQASEVLIAIGADKNLCSQAEVIQRAWEFGWRPVDYSESSEGYTLVSDKTVNSSPSAINTSPSSNKNNTFFWLNCLLFFINLFCLVVWVLKFFLEDGYTNLEFLLICLYTCVVGYYGAIISSHLKAEKQK